MSLLNYEEELKNYNERLKHYNEIAGETRTGTLAESTPLLTTAPITTTVINNNDLAQTNDPDKLAEKYEKLAKITDQLNESIATPNCSPCGLYDKQKFYYRRNKLREAAERLKTAILQALLKKMIADLGIENEIELLKEAIQQSFWKKMTTYFLWVSTLIYGCFKGYSAVAGVLAAFTGPESIALIASSSVSAGLFCLMLAAFEGREICHVRGLTGYSFFTRARILTQTKEQYQLATEMSNQIRHCQREEEKQAQQPNHDKQEKLEKYHSILTKIHDKDLSPKIKDAITYKDNATRSTTRKCLETGAGVTLGILNGASFGFVGVSTMAVVLKCTLATLLVAGLSTATGGIALGVFGLLFIAGFAAAWYAKKLGANLVKTLDQREVMLNIAETEQKDRGTNSLKTKINDSCGFFERRALKEKVATQEEELESFSLQLAI